MRQIGGMHMVSARVRYEGDEVNPSQGEVELSGPSGEVRTLGVRLGQVVIVAPEPSNESVRVNPVAALLRAARVIDMWQVPAADLLDVSVRWQVGDSFSTRAHVTGERLRTMVDDSEGRLRPSLVRWQGWTDADAAEVAVVVAGVTFYASFRKMDPWLAQVGLVEDVEPLPDADPPHVPDPDSGPSEPTP